MGRSTSRDNQGRNKRIPPPGRRGQPSPPKTQDREYRPRCDFYWPPLLPRPARPLSSHVFITRVTNDSISIHICSDWSMRDHRVRSELCAHCPTTNLPFRVPPGTDKECMLCIFHKGPAVATRLIVSFLEALQVRIKATMARNGPKALTPSKSRLERAFYPARWRAPGSDGVSISRIGQHAISSAIS